MARDRTYGEDKPLLAWVRQNPNLPSSGITEGFAVTDTDFMIHRYKVAVDKQGSREVQAMMQIEGKTRGGVPSPSQQDTLWKHDAFRGAKTVGSDRVWFLGVFVLVLSGTTPVDSEQMWWGRFLDSMNDRIQWDEIDVEMFERILRFDVNPRKLNRQIFRRHHKTQKIIVYEQTELGFGVHREIVKRS